MRLLFKDIVIETVSQDEIAFFLQSEEQPMAMEGPIAELAPEMGA